jgi:hypothetical protein
MTSAAPSSPLQGQGNHLRARFSSCGRSWGAAQGSQGWPPPLRSISPASLSTNGNQYRGGLWCWSRWRWRRRPCCQLPAPCRRLRTCDRRTRQHQRPVPARSNRCESRGASAYRSLRLFEELKDSSQQFAASHFQALFAYVENPNSDRSPTTVFLSRTRLRGSIVSAVTGIVGLSPYTERAAAMPRLPHDARPCHSARQSTMELSLVTESMLRSCSSQSWTIVSRACARRKSKVK